MMDGKYINHKIIHQNRPIPGLVAQIPIISALLIVEQENPICWFINRSFLSS